MTNRRPHRSHSQKAHEIPKDLIHSSLQYLTVSYFKPYYANVKNYSSTLKSGLEAVEKKVAWVPQLSDPVIQRLDEQLNVVLNNPKVQTSITTVQDKFIPVAKQYFYSLDVDHDGKIGLSDLSNKGLESVYALGNQVKAFSGNQLKSVIHVDLVEYASLVLHNAQETTSREYHRVNEKLGAAISKVTVSVHAVQEELKRRTSERLASVESSEFTKLILQTLLAARDLSQTAAQAYTDVVHFTREHAANIAASPTQSLRNILNSASVLHKAGDQVEQENGVKEAEVHGLLGIINELLVTGKDLLFLRTNNLRKSVSKDATVARKVHEKSC